MKTNHRFILILLVITMAMLPFACGDDDDDDNDDGTPADDDTTDDDTTDDDTTDDDDDTTPTSTTMSFATYNTGLAYGFVPLAEERLPELYEAVPELDVDALCLQEVWYEDDRDGMVAALAETLPYIYKHNSIEDFANQPPESEARCGNLDNLISCAETNCDVNEVEGLLDCVIDNCLLPLIMTGFDCIECLASQIDQPFDDMVDYCTNPNPPPLSYTGSNGLILASNLELTDTEMLQLDFFLTVRVALHAKVQTETGPLHLYCTHLTAAISILPYNGDYPSYEAEQAAQIAALLNWVEETSEGEPAVLMGDFNNGPGVGGDPDEFPANYAALTGAGMTDPYAVQHPDLCTYCSENPLNDEDTNDAIIDHLFFRGFGTPDFVAERIFTEPITLTVDEEQVESRLSDHYGNMVTATW
ncbi:MAG TPA: endonuclease/exonuclease/phosphatase family protein [bacterium]|nr:endonuclease/exonuclease/phosphatase family protein [bacterium]